MRIKGTGLGLFIVSSHRAQARRTGLRRKPRPRPRQHLHPPASGGAAGMSRILVVEDEQHLADGLRFNLEAESYDAEVVETGEAALDRIFGDGDPVDLVVLDVMLPGLSGFDVVRRLRESGRYLPVLMLTARGHADDVVRGFEAGADDYLPKPFDLSVLIARITALLRRQAWGRRGEAAARGGRSGDAGPVRVRRTRSSISRRWRSGATTALPR